MKTFDITFKGTVLPGHDSAQVRQDFARLFGIEDQDALKDIFSGEPVVLCRGLDRKAAADYFRKISKLGSEAQLSDSLERNPTAGHSAIQLQQQLPDIPVTPAPPPEKIPAPIPRSGEAGQLWAVSAGPRECPEHKLAMEVAEQVNRSLTRFRRRLARLQSLTTQTESRSQQESLLLERKIEHFHRIAEEELKKIESMGKAARTMAAQQIEAIESRQQEAARAAEMELSRQQHEKDQRSSDYQLERQHWGEQEEAVVLQREAALKGIEGKRSGIRLEADQEIARLEQQIAKTREQADMRLGKLEEKLVKLREVSERELASVQDSIATSTRRWEQYSQVLREQEAAAKQLLARKQSDLAQQLAEVLRIQAKELARLQAMEQDITEKRSAGVARIRETATDLREQTERNLQRITTLRQETLRKQSEALGDSQDAAQPSLLEQAVSAS